MSAQRLAALRSPVGSQPLPVKPDIAIDTS